MKKWSFTIMEILLAMSIIGILAAVTVNTMGKMSANKTKVAFQANYRHMVETINSILADETAFPNIDNGETDDSGHAKMRPLREMVFMNPSTGQTIVNEGAFPQAFSNATNTVGNTTSITKGYEFTAKNGSYWRVAYNSSHGPASGTVTDVTKADYFIIFDVNGKYEGSNCPFNMAQDATEGSNCKTPDTFRFGLTYNNKILPDTQAIYDSCNLKTYMRRMGIGNGTNAGS